MVNKTEFDEEIFVKVRSTGKLLAAKINLKDQNNAQVNLKISEDGISPGQACVFTKKINLGIKFLVVAGLEFNFFHIRKDKK